MSTHRFGGTPADSPVPPHDALIGQQFGLQAERFAGRLSSIAMPGSMCSWRQPRRNRRTNRSMSLAVREPSWRRSRATRAVPSGSNSTPEMLDQARTLGAERKLPMSNGSWQMCTLPFAGSAFDIVTCRFASIISKTHRRLSEMVRLCRPGGRVVLCDAVASPNAGKAQAFNAMERHRDPYRTVEFRTLPYLQGLFAAAGFPPPSIRRFLVTYERDQLIAKSFPVNDDRDTLGRMIDGLIATDAMDVGTAPGETRFHLPAVVLTATKG